MADGKGTRWNNYMGIPKHFAEISGEKLILRTVRLLHKLKQEDIEVIVTSHDQRYEFAGSRRYEPQNNRLEIDRFTEELIEDDMCFLYGDTYYTENAIQRILETQTDDILFFGNRKTIVGVKIKDSELFRKHVATVRKLYLEGQISKCIGWQVYQSLTNQDFEKAAELGRNFIFVDEQTVDIDTEMDYNAFQL